MDDPSLRIPDAIEPISAYRAWFYSIEGRTAYLYPFSGPPAPSFRYEWEGAGSNWVTASCHVIRSSTHEVPSEGCSCGFYSLKDLDLAVVLAGIHHLLSTQGHSGSQVVLGRILLSGKVIEHEYGYRAERARIAELIPFRGTERSVMVLAHRLGVGMAPVVEPPLQEETLDRVHPALSALRGGRTQGLKRRIAAPPDIPSRLAVGVLGVVGLVATIIMLLVGGQPPGLLVIWSVVLLGRHGDSLGTAYRDWRDRRRRGSNRLRLLPPVPPAAASTR